LHILNVCKYRTGIWWKYDDETVSTVPIDADTFDTVSDTSKKEEKASEDNDKTNGNGTEENGKEKAKNNSKVEFLHMLLSSYLMAFRKEPRKPRKKQHLQGTYFAYCDCIDLTN